MDCERHSDWFPEEIPEYATLYLATPDEDVRRSLREVVLRSGVESDESFDGVLAVNAKARGLRTLSDGWAAALGQTDLKDTRCLLFSARTKPSASDLMRTQRLWDLVKWVDGQWVQGLVRSRQLQTHFQPIVYSADPSRVFAYECLLRGVEDDGRLIPPMRLFAAARAVRMMQSLDEAARLTAAESASRHKLTGCVFVNFNPRSIGESAECFDSTIEAVLQSGIPAERFVFEVVESEEIVDIQRLLRLLDSCRQAGCRVALDDVGAGYSSLNLLAQIKPDYIKIDMSLIRDVCHDPYVDRVTAKVLELAKELQVETVVEGVETVGQWQWAVDHGAEFAQGYLFARPASVPPPSLFSGSSEDLATMAAAGCEADGVAVAAGKDQTV